MKNASQGIREFGQFLRGCIEDELEEFAEELEENTRQDRDWQDDTGSAADAITAYLVGKGDARKNFGSAAWEEAQAAGSEKYGTPPKNYAPHVETVHVGESDHRKVVVLTNFVPYARILELGGGPTGGWGGNLLQISTEGHESALIMRMVSALSKALRRASTG